MVLKFLRTTGKRKVYFNFACEWKK